MVYQVPGIVLYAVGMGIAAPNAPTTTRAGTVINPGNPGMMGIGFLLVGIGVLYMMGMGIYNHIIKQGKTGQTFGKARRGLRLVHQDTGQLIGTGQTFVRQLAHMVDGIAYVGYLWPLWDPMRQTFADKIMKTVVVKER